ncbi:uncharacterized protein LOC116195324 [Punica granatum]|uniref:DUF538 domain-containing protein n=2 Tax=Punica granatum TaxID=22663 RepID=A0A218WGS4_PUNGR|nr:uncharacterized protein LOC116195324 [Punica granatum]OWM71698.1 hypothetical protein CDL15_Pgr005886 [Punica granatum]PKI46228.1 hypothetical protein CRG98_033355 [Punica granatum]
MANQSLLLYLIFSLLLLLLLPSSYQTPEPATPRLSVAHTELTNYGFPVGLLPSDVSAYSINATSGEFSVDLAGACRITLPPDNYLAAYSKRIKGRIVRGKIAHLDGIRVRAFFSWWSITGIRASGDNLVFEVGSVSAKYPSKNFDESPACEGRQHSAS